MSLAACARLPCSSSPRRSPARARRAPGAPDAAASPADAAARADAAPADAATAEPDAGAAGIDAAQPDARPREPYTLPPEPQRSGDPMAGRAALLDRGYVGCGVPDSAYRLAMGSAPINVRLPGRDALNADLPYDQTRFVTSSSVTVVTANCLTCHGSLLDGRVVIGLGNASANFTGDQSGAADLVGLVLSRPDEIAEWQKWAERVRAISPFIQTRTIGVNPADNLAAALFAHRDRETLAWSSQPLLELPSTTPLPVDVPAWWLLKKKSSMFWVGSGRGDHARIMMTASTLCVDTVAEAESIDAYFPDVRSYFLSLEPPPFPRTVTATLAEQGRAVFDASCALCHGSYGAAPSYPNYVVPVEEIGTDPFLASGSEQYSERFVSWFNGSWYGQRARLEPQPGYVAPPLDGLWATAPYLHNGSVPTLEALLDSSRRPTYWTRSFGTSLADYDDRAMGWRTTALDHGQADEPNANRRRQIYDTTFPGYGNGGHTYGDALTTGERAAVLEYLKTL